MTCIRRRHILSTENWINGGIPRDIELMGGGESPSLDSTRYCRCDVQCLIMMMSLNNFYCSLYFVL